MIKKGTVTDNVNNKIRVTFPDISDSITYVMTTAGHIGALEIGNEVIVAFFNDTFSDGIIIGRVI